MENKKETDLVVKPKAEKAQLVAHDNSEFASLLDTGKFQQMFKAASLFSQSQLIPVQYQNKPANCFVALQMAVRLKVDPMMFMQNTYVVHSKPAMEAKLKIALINQNGPFVDPIQWEFSGQGNERECTAFGILPSGVKCEAKVTMKMVISEGWIKNDKWKNMPDLMFQYRSASFLGNLFCPQILMGMQSPEEVEDVGDNADQTYESKQVEAQEVIAEQSGSEVTEAAFEEKQPEQEQEQEPEPKVSEDGINEDWM